MHFLAILLIVGGLFVAVFGTLLSFLAAGSTPIAGSVSAAPLVLGILAALVGAGMLVFG